MVPVSYEIYIALLNPLFHVANQKVWLGPPGNTINLFQGYVGVYVHRIDRSRFTRIPAPLDSIESGLAHWPSIRKIAQLRTITVVRQLHKNESNDYKVKPYVVKLKPSGQSRSNWRDWLQTETVKVERWHVNDNIWNINSCEIEKETLTIYFKGYMLFALVNTKPTRSFPLRSFVIGMDSESSLLDFVSMSLDSRSLASRFGDIVWFPSDILERDGCNNEWLIDVQCCEGGQYRVMGDSAVAFRLLDKMGGLNGFYSKMKLSTG